MDLASSNARPLLCGHFLGAPLPKDALREPFLPFVRGPQREDFSISAWQPTVSRWTSQKLAYSAD